MCEFSVCYQFFKDCHENGSLTWCISNDKFSLFYYYNGKDIDFNRKSNRLNIIANKYEVSKKGKKLLFCMETSNAEKWNYDFLKKVEFVVKR